MRWFAGLVVLGALAFAGAYLGASRSTARPHLASTPASVVVAAPLVSAAEAVERIVDDRRITRGSTVTFDRGVEVAHGARLIIEPGARLEFAPGAYLAVHGELRAIGTGDAPIVFTSTGGCPDSHRWNGIGFASDARRGSIVAHAVVSCAGDVPSRSGFSGAITVSSPPFAVTITHVAFRENGMVDVSASAPFARFEDNVLGNGVAAMFIDADALGSIGERNRFGGPIRTSGRVARSQKWPALGVPIDVVSLQIDGDDELATLTLAGGTELAFVGDGVLEVGSHGSTGKGGALVAHGAIFGVARGSLDPELRWAGVRLLARAGGTTLDGCLVEDAEIGIAADDLEGVRVRDTTFARVGAAFVLAGPCEDALGAPSGNRAVGAELCGRAPPRPK